MQRLVAGSSLAVLALACSLSSFLGGGEEAPDPTAEPTSTSAADPAAEPASAPAGAEAAGTQAAGAAPAAGQASATLASGFVPDPHVLTGTSGGPVQASGMEATCTGWVPAAPSHVVTAQTAFPLLRFVVNGGGQDTTLLVRTPSGAIECVDDSDGIDPIVEVQSAGAGTYQLFVGSYHAGASHPYRLGITELASVMAANVGAPAGLAAPSGSPQAGSVALAASSARTWIHTDGDRIVQVSLTLTNTGSTPISVARSQIQCLLAGTPGNAWARETSLADSTELVPGASATGTVGWWWSGAGSAPVVTVRLGAQEQVVALGGGEPAAGGAQPAAGGAQPAADPVAASRVLLCSLCVSSGAQCGACPAACRACVEQNRTDTSPCFSACGDGGGGTQPPAVATAGQPEESALDLCMRCLRTSGPICARCSREHPRCHACLQNGGSASRCASTCGGGGAEPAATPSSSRSAPSLGGYRSAYDACSACFGSGSQRGCRACERFPACGECMNNSDGCRPVCDAEQGGGAGGGGTRTTRQGGASQYRVCEECAFEGMAGQASCRRCTNRACGDCMHDAYAGDGDASRCESLCR